jgi:hypothetical protein
MKLLIEKNESQIEQIEKVLVWSITKETQPYNGSYIKFKLRGSDRPTI